MALKWSCFLSFRGGKGDLALGIVDLLAKALTNELELQTDAGLYRYCDEMVAGDERDSSKPVLASASQQSKSKTTEMAMTLAGKPGSC